MSSEAVQILVMDDDEQIRESLICYLEDHDYLVVGVASAEEALEWLASNPCRLVVVDLRLPGMDGNQFIQQAHQEYPALRYLIHTGSVDYQIGEELRAIGLGSENLLFKPVLDLGVLVARIGELLQL